MCYHDVSNCLGKNIQSSYPEFLTQIRKVLKKNTNIEPNENKKKLNKVVDIIQFQKYLSLTKSSSFFLNEIH